MQDKEGLIAISHTALTYAEQRNKSSAESEQGNVEEPYIRKWTDRDDVLFVVDVFVYFGIGRLPVGMTEWLTKFLRLDSC